MKNFRVFLPINKGLPSKSHYQVVEMLPNGEQKTRYKLEGIASTTALDRDTERVSKACLNRMVNSIRAKKLPIFGNHEHEWENMLAYAENAEVIGDELHISMISDYIETNPKVSQLIGKLEAGMPLGLSIGGKVTESKDVYEDSLGKNINMIEDVDLFETSIVGISANPEAYLSLPEQIAKSLKEENKLSNTRKSAGQLGMASYGKLGETTPEARCPECGRPGELRHFEDGTAAYLCNYDGILFTVESQGKIPATPDNNPANVPASTIDAQVQEPLGTARKSRKGDNLIKQEETNETEKQEEEETKKQTEEETEKQTEEETTKQEETENEKRCKQEEDEYQKFKKFMKQYEDEMEKAEGVTTEPGGENEDAENEIGGATGQEVATPVHAKSMKNFEAMKKAIKENTGVEGLEKKAKSERGESLSFKSMRDERLLRK